MLVVAHNDVGVFFRAAAELFGGAPCVARPAASAPCVECTGQRDALKDRLAAGFWYSAAPSRWHSPLKRCRRVPGGPFPQNRATRSRGHSPPGRARRAACALAAGPSMPDLKPLALVRAPAHLAGAGLSVTQPTRQQWRGSFALEVNENKEDSNPIERSRPQRRRDAARSCGESVRHSTVAEDPRAESRSLPRCAARAGNRA